MSDFNDEGFEEYTNKFDMVCKTIHLIAPSKKQGFRFVRIARSMGLSIDYDIKEDGFYIYIEREEKNLVQLVDACESIISQTNEEIGN